MAAGGERGAGTEWPTVLLAAVIYGCWLALTRFHAALPLWLLVPAGGWLVAWHGSLQHETIHGHPTRDARINAAIGGVPLSLWLPYASYRRDHRAHHDVEDVTDPVADPESRYLPAAPGLAARAIAVVQAPLLGRLVLGPPIGIVAFLAEEAARLRVAPRAVVRDWLPHLAGVAIVLAWLRLCDLPLGLYLLAFVYPGAALSLLRSFAEHRAADEPGHRVAIVERAGPFAWLFLNNNLHAAHHRAPGVAWYALPAFYAANRAAILRDNGGLLYRGYGEIARRYALRPQDALTHPGFA